MNLTIITPSYRPENLEKVKASIDFKRIKKWLIFHNANFGPTPRQFHHPKIRELSLAGDDWGFRGRNWGLDLVHNGSVYFLDDDNLMHPDFWRCYFKPGFYYSFDCRTAEKIIPGQPIVRGQVDLGQFVFDRALIGEKRFKTSPALRNADGLFVAELKKKLPKHHIYVNEIIAYYNALR